MPRHVPRARGRARRQRACASPRSPTSRTAATTSRPAAEETAAAVAAGADEVDVVAPIGALLEGDVGLVGELVEACRAAAGPGITLKLILETGALREPDLITAAARAAVMAGVDFLKTSTGKTEVGATLEAAAALLAVLPRGRRPGRASRRRAASAPRPMPPATCTSPTRSWGRAGRRPRTFRFGASSLLDDLLGRGGAGAAATDAALPAAGDHPRQARRQRAGGRGDRVLRRAGSPTAASARARWRRSPWPCSCAA